jgi:hypothetical protein
MNCDSQKFQATARGGLSTKATERALRVSKRCKKKVCLKTRYLVSASSRACTVESTTEESSREIYAIPVRQLKGKEKKVSLLLLMVLRLFDLIRSLRPYQYSFS